MTRTVVLAALLVPTLVAPAGAQAIDPQGLLSSLVRDAGAGDLSSVKSWVAQGVDVNGQVGRARQTALMTAAGRGRTDVVTYLLSVGADPTLRDADGRTALDHARRGSDPRLVALLEKPAAPTAGGLAKLTGPRSSMMPGNFPEGAILVDFKIIQEDLTSPLYAAARALGRPCGKVEVVAWSDAPKNLPEQLDKLTSALGFARKALSTPAGSVGAFELDNGPIGQAGVWMQVGNAMVLSWCVLPFKPVR
ncbi:ankyrin repeat domain-containing protein [Deinococcus pimensis]|uniref:ankyrin repeat domain-containing protein n=1 Tax=Deinococcus pimensis TaxID=309888 RepID=UPI0004B0E11A|nr:ankyrin repeat domain-containing protein [Deinococcus pimensis]